MAELSGLAEIQRKADALSKELEWEDEEEEGVEKDDEGVLL